MQSQPQQQDLHQQQHQYNNNQIRQSAATVTAPSVGASDSQLCQIISRLKATTSPEERKNVFADLKKTPHLFAAFLKMNKNEGNQSGGSGGSQDTMMQQQQGRQPNWMPQQQFQHGNRGGGQPPPPGGNSSSYNNSQWTAQ